MWRIIGRGCERLEKELTKKASELRNKVVINAVYSDDLEEFLDSIGLLGDLVNGKLRCFNCGRMIDRSNLSAVFPHNDQICVCCSSLDCYAALINVRRST